MTDTRGMAKSARRTSTAKKFRTVHSSEKSAAASLGANPKGYGVVRVKDRRGRLKGYRAW
jgi:hypothetical protein